MEIKIIKVTGINISQMFGLNLLLSITFMRDLSIVAVKEAYHRHASIFPELF